MRKAQQDPLRGFEWDLRKKEPSEVMLSFSLTSWESVMLFPKMKKEKKKKKEEERGQDCVLRKRLEVSFGHGD